MFQNTPTFQRKQFFEFVVIFWTPQCIFCMHQPNLVFSDVVFRRPRSRRIFQDLNQTTIVVIFQISSSGFKRHGKDFVSEQPTRCHNEWRCVLTKCPVRTSMLLLCENVGHASESVGLNTTGKEFKIFFHEVIANQPGTPTRKNPPSSVA